MGIGYELIKFAGKHDNIVTKVISAPGVWLQHLTVFEPDDGMIECAIKAFVEVLPEDEKPVAEPVPEEAAPIEEAPVAEVDAETRMNADMEEASEPITETAPDSLDCEEN